MNNGHGRASVLSSMARLAIRNLRCNFIFPWFCITSYLTITGIEVTSAKYTHVYKLYVHTSTRTYFNIVFLVPVLQYRYATATGIAILVLEYSMVLCVKDGIARE